MNRPPTARTEQATPALPILRLYIARATPNSVRAEQNLRAALDEIASHGLRLPYEIVDVFTNPKRAITDGVIVTPTLFGLTPQGRMTMMGDLTEATKLNTFLCTLQDACSRPQD